jgi:hypothetical protein
MFINYARLPKLNKVGMFTKFVEIAKKAGTIFTFSSWNDEGIESWSVFCMQGNECSMYIFEKGRMSKERFCSLVRERVATFRDNRIRLVFGESRLEGGKRVISFFSGCFDGICPARSEKAMQFACNAWESFVKTMPQDKTRVVRLDNGVVRAECGSYVLESPKAPEVLRFNLTFLKKRNYPVGKELLSKAA